MGFRFRRLFRKEPFHLTLSKSGIGWSVGFPGVRYGVGGNGRRYISIGIPGTGFYWFKYLPRFRKSSQLQAPPTVQTPPPLPPTPQPPPPTPIAPQSSNTSQPPWWMQ